jgi:short-subunit dehydrogenase involved in D-alanine esterification of teichoic acids
LGVQDVKDRDDKKEIARAIGKLQSNTNVIIDKNGLYVGIKGVKQQMTRAWQ